MKTVRQLREGGLAHVETQFPLALLLIGAVAGVAVVGEDGPDVAVVVDLRGRRRRLGGAGPRRQGGEAEGHEYRKEATEAPCGGHAVCSYRCVIKASAG